MGLQPAGGTKDVYEVFCDAPGWSASAGTFHVDAKGDAYVILTTAVKRGQYDRIRVVRREHLASGKIQTYDILGAKLMRRIAILAATAALTLAACGGDDRPTPAATPAAAGGDGATLKIAADPGGAKKFTESALTATAGTVTVEFDNQSSLPHAVTIEGNGVDVTSATVTGDDAPAIKAELPAGEYTYYCPVGDHRAEGMEGKLTVR